MSLRERVQQLVEARGFQQTIMTVIVVNAATLGVATSPDLADSVDGLLRRLVVVALAIFAVELLLKLYARIVGGSSAIPGTSSTSRWSASRWCPPSCRLGAAGATLVEAGTAPQDRSADHVVLDRALRHLTAAADRVVRIAEVKDSIEERVQSLADAVASRHGYGLIHGELGPRPRPCR